MFDHPFLIFENKLLTILLIGKKLCFDNFNQG